MKAKSSAGKMLSRCCNDIGAPNELHMDNAPEMIGDDTQFREVCRTQRIRTTTIELKSPWQNKYENLIGIISKKAVNRRMRRYASKCVWDF